MAEHDVDETMISRLEAIAERVNSGGDVGRSLQNLVSAVALHSPWRQCWAGLLDVADRAVISSFHVGFEPEATRELDGVVVADSPSLRVIETGEPLLFPDVSQATEFPTVVRDGPRSGYGSIMYVPIRVEDLWAVVTFSRPEAGEFSAVEQSLAKVIASFAAIAFRNVLSRERELAVERDVNARLSALNEIISSQNASLERLARVQTRLLQEQAGSGGLHTLCATIGELLESPVVLVDRFFQVLSFADLGPDEASSIAAKVLQGTNAVALRKAQRPLHIEAGGESLLVGQAVDGGDSLAMLIVVRGDRVEDDLERRILELGCLHLSLEVMRERANLDAQVRLQQDFAEALLARDGAGFDLSARASIVGIRLGMENIVLRTRFSGDAPGVEHRDAYALASLMRRRLSDIGVDVVVSAVTQSDFVIVAVAGSLPPHLLLRATGLVRRTLREAMVTVHDVPASAFSIQIGIGSSAVGVEGLRRSHVEALRALEVLALTGGGDRDLSIADAGSYSLLTSTDAGDRSAFVDRYLSPLIAYDAEHGSDYLETLRIYFESVGNLQRVADRLFLHISTARYRLTRIEEIAGFSLRDEDDRLCVQLALKLLSLSPSTAPAASAPR